MLSENLKNLRKAKGFSQEELATLDRLQKKMLKNLSAWRHCNGKEVPKT